ncbi:MAG: hypothetical protein M3R27_12695 [Bacteroidota bacterium]|nr:hypothetical protein [Bacteroidota bacterium]
MQKIKTKEGTISGRVSSQLAQTSRIRKQKRTPKAGRRKLPTRESNTSGRNSDSYTLKAATRDIPYLRVANLQGMRGVVFSSDSDMLQGIKDLYPVISNMKGFSEPSWAENAHPSEVLHNLLHQFESIQRPEEWGVRQEDGKYVISATNMFGNGDPIFIPIDFLSQINRTHKRLHDFLIYALRLVYHTNNIGMIHDWVCNEYGSGMYYEFLESRQDDYQQETDDENEENLWYRYHASLEYYGKKGVVAAYSKMLTGAASLRMFKKELESFKPRNKYEEEALPFLQAALVLAETKKSILDYSQEPNDCGEATPKDYMRIVWNFDDNDLMYKEFSECLDASVHGCGVVPFCWMSTYGDEKSDNYREDVNVCKKFEDFFMKGNEMANNIKSDLKGVCQQPPLPLNQKNTKNGRLVNILV